MLRWLFIIISLWLFISFSPLAVIAGTDFSSAVKVTYEYQPDGISLVTHQVTLTNLTSQSLASSYRLVLYHENPTDITGKDAFGPLKISVSPVSGDAVALDIKLNNPVAGKGKSKTFSISYHGKPAQKINHTWHLLLPKLSDTVLTDRYQLFINTPPDFGNPTTISPRPDSFRQLSNGYRSFAFTGDQISRLGVTAIFGDYINLSFKLNYLLKNSSNQTQTVSLILPSDSSLQRIIFDSIQPFPENIQTDDDGNWLALFPLLPNSSLPVLVSGQVHILSEPFSILSKTSSVDLIKYTQATDSWPATESSIIATAKSIATPDKIASYLIQNNISDPVQYSDMFVTLSRSAGIPARLGVGIPVTLSGQTSVDKLSVWPEYWESASENWLESDVNQSVRHMRLGVRGISSSMPDIPFVAGTFSAGEFHSIDPVPLQISWQPPTFFRPGADNHTRLLLSNPSGIALYNTPLVISALNLPLQNPSRQLIDIFPPFSHQTLPLDFTFGGWPNFSSKSLSITAGSGQITYNISSRLFIFWHLGFALFIFTCIVTLAVFASYAGSLHLQKHRR